MNEKICAFCGHRMVADYDLEERVLFVLSKMIRYESYTSFYSGGMGEFDNICERAVRKLKKEYPYIKLYRVIYKYKKGLEDVRSIVDDIIIPDLGDVYYKKAISLRNQWMAEVADAVLCYIRKEYGGAYIMMKYAKKVNAEIVML